MTKPIPYLLQGKNIILVIDGKSHTISRDTHMSYIKIVDALKAQDWDALRDLVEPKKAMVNFGAGNVAINGDEITWKGQPFHNSLASRMIEMYADGFPIDPMVRFMENLMNNPSKRSVTQVYSFLEKNKLPITEDGYFLAYKRVRSDYLDVHSGTISNKVGCVVEMDRNLVDDNPESHCSTGLHFCSESYLSGFGSARDPVMILKISPADVVSIPTDYDGAKGRCCRYEVVGQVNGKPEDAFSSVVNKEFSPKPAPVVAPKACWPFPDSEEGSAQLFDNLEEDFGIVFDEDDSDVDDVLYDLVRVHGGWAEYEGMTLDEARERVAKNDSQKKAKLKIVLAGTQGPEVE